MLLPGEQDRWFVLLKETGFREALAGQVRTELGLQGWQNSADKRWQAVLGGMFLDSP